VRGIASDFAPFDSRSSSLPQGAGIPPRIALVGKTIHDVRSVMVEGVSGLLTIHPVHERPVYEPSKRRIT
jgi:phage terminase large subunit-like protein